MNHGFVLACVGEANIRRIAIIVADNTHSDAQFAGSSSVPVHVEMSGFLGMGNNPMGASVAVAVALEQAQR